MAGEYDMAREWCDASFNSSSIANPFCEEVEIALTPMKGDKINQEYWLSSKYWVVFGSNAYERSLARQIETKIRPAILHRVRCAVCFGKIVVRTLDEAEDICSRVFGDIMCRACKKAKREAPIRSHRHRWEVEFPLSLRYMSQTRYRMSAPWHELEAAARQLAKGKCQWCRDESDELFAYSIAPERRGCERLSDLMVLCSICRSRFERRFSIRHLVW